MVPENTWRDALEDNIIIGLKELPVEECELIDVYGCYKWQLMSLKSPLSTYMSNSPTVISNKEDGKKFLLDFLEETEFS